MRIPILLALAFAGSACVSEVTGEPCTSDGRCLYGYQCVAGLCESCPLEECETSQITLLSTGGGLACDREGTCVRFPAGALGGLTEIEVARTANPNDTIGAPPLSKVYAVRPTSILPLEPVEVIFRVSRQVDARDPVTIQRALDPRGPWESLPTTRDNTRASAYTDVLGFFALGRVQDGPPPPPTDGGPITPPPPTDGGPATPPRDAGPMMAQDPLTGISAPRPLTNGAVAGLHGVAWDPTMRRFFFSSMQPGTVLTFTHQNQMPDPPTVFRGNIPNVYGLVVDDTGRLLMMEFVSRTITTATMVNQAMPLITTFQGQQFNGPADAAVRSDGTIYFTDPGTGLAITGAARQLQFNGVFRQRPAGGALNVEWQGPVTSEPRGIELSNDAQALYVADTAGNVVMAWDVLPEGDLTNRRDFATPTGGGPDGLAVDRDGNVYVGTEAGVEVFAPDGTRWGNIAVPRRVGALAFGGPDRLFLYATASNELYVMSVTIPGAR